MKRRKPDDLKPPTLQIKIFYCRTQITFGYIKIVYEIINAIFIMGSDATVARLSLDKAFKVSLGSGE